MPHVRRTAAAVISRFLAPHDKYILVTGSGRAGKLSSWMISWIRAAPSGRPLPATSPFCGRCATGSCRRSGRQVDEVEARRPARDFATAPGSMVPRLEAGGPGGRRNGHAHWPRSFQPQPSHRSPARKRADEGTSLAHGLSIYIRSWTCKALSGETEDPCTSTPNARFCRAHPDRRVRHVPASHVDAALAAHRRPAPACTPDRHRSPAALPEMRQPGRQPGAGDRRRAGLRRQSGSSRRQLGRGQGRYRRRAVAAKGRAAEPLRWSRPGPVPLRARLCPRHSAAGLCCKLRRHRQGWLRAREGPSHA